MARGADLEELVVTHASYLEILGRELERYIDEEISLDDLVSKMSEIDSRNIPRDLYNQVWHAVYQYDVDCSVDDFRYTQGVRQSMGEIVRSLQRDGYNLKQSLVKYFNHPCSEN